MGIESIRILLNIKAPLLILLGLALLAWAYIQAGGFGEMLSRPSQFAAGQPKEGKFWGFFILALTGNVSFWATLALNIPDFTRYAKSQKDQLWGQILGLPTTMGLYSFIGVAVTSAAFVIYANRPDVVQKDLWDPVYLLSLFDNKAVLVFAMVALALATLATNIAANVVSPSNDFAHLWPRMISFRIGGLITGIIGISDSAVAIVGQRQRLYRQVADRLLAPLGRRRRRADRRLLRHPPHQARSSRPVSQRRPLLVPRRIQSHRHLLAAVRHRPVHPRFPGGSGKDLRPAEPDRRAAPA